MPSAKPSWLKNVVLVGTTAVAVSTFSDLNIVQYITGNSYQAGTSEITTASGVTVTAGGGQFIATQLNGAPCRQDPVSGRKYDCVQHAVFAATGGCVAQGCGTRSYNPASITKPYTGSGVIKRVEVSCDRSMVSTYIDVDQLAATTSSGHAIMQDRLIGSGALVAKDGFGSDLFTIASGSLLWKETTPILKVSAGDNVKASQCLFSVWSDEMYNP